MDIYPISSISLEKFYSVNGNQLAQQYKDHLSDYSQWEQKEHAQDWMLFENNIGTDLSIDETALSNGDLYTILTNKAANGKKGAIVAMIKGTESETVINILKKIPKKKQRRGIRNNA